MILTCPHCGSQFRIDPALLGEHGRRVRCSACGERWLAVPGAATADPPAASAVPEPEAPVAPGRVTPRFLMPAPQAQPVVAQEGDEPPADVILAQGLPLDGEAEGRRGGHRSAVVGWLVVVLGLLLAAGAILARDQIANSFPATAGVFERLGLPVTVRSGLEFKNLTSERSEADGIVTLVVAGDIHNIAAGARNLPAVRVGLLDEARNEIDFSLRDLPQRLLPAGETMHFELKLVDPPANARTFRVTFDSAP